MSLRKRRGAPICVFQGALCLPGWLKGGSAAAAQWASEAHAVPGRHQIASSVLAIHNEGGREIEARMSPTSLKWTEKRSWRAGAR